ncbi:MAG: outer membrane beta-barrel protein [Ferruginibacter sp.]
MKTIKFFLIFPSMFFCITSYSQISFDLHAGVNIGNLRTRIYGSREKGFKPAIGYTIPIHINIPLSKSLFFQTGLAFESVHHKFDRTNYYDNPPISQVQRFTSKSHLDYINIPLKIYYKVNSIFAVGFGPFIGIGIAGRDKGNNTLETTNSAVTTTEGFRFDNKVKFGLSTSEVKRLNLGLSLNLAYLFSEKYIVGLYSNFGLRSTNNNDNIDSKTITGGLTIGYRFLKKRAGK